MRFRTAEVVFTLKTRATVIWSEVDQKQLLRQQQPTKTTKTTTTATTKTIQQQLLFSRWLIRSPKLMERMTISQAISPRNAPKTKINIYWMLSRTIVVLLPPSASFLSLLPHRIYWISRTIWLKNTASSTSSISNLLPDFWVNSSSGRRRHRCRSHLFLPAYWQWVNAPLSRNRPFIILGLVF